MTVETETILIKLLERIEQKLDRFIETTNQKFENVQKDMTDLKVGQARLEEKTSSLQQGQEIINTKINTQNTWLLSLITALIVGVLGLIVTIGKVVFFPNV